LSRDINAISKKNDLRIDLCRFIIEKLYTLPTKESENDPNEFRLVQFSVTEIQKQFAEQIRMNTSEKPCTIGDVEEALLYLSKIGALKLEGGFMVIYNAMQIHRLTDMKYKYKKEDYRLLDEFYKQKIRQIHIVGEYANLMVKDYGAALQFVQDYFLLDHKKFVSRYFKGDRAKEIEKNITMEKYRQLFGELSEKQREIIQDKQSKCIVVAAGPGSGKTRVLVHKLASLLLMEDVKHEQLLMLTFSRAAAIEFKQRLIKLIGGAAHFVDIKTFHSYSFDLIGKMGNLEDMNQVVRMAADMIENGEDMGEMGEGLFGSLPEGTSVYTGVMEGFTIEMTFVKQESNINGTFKDVMNGYSMHLDGESTPAMGGDIVFYGNMDGSNWTFNLTGNANEITGQADNGATKFNLSLNKK
jgi:ATP-dependent DNA helicase RecQ